MSHFPYDGKMLHFTFFIELGFLLLNKTNAFVGFHLKLHTLQEFELKQSQQKLEYFFYFVLLNQCQLLDCRLGLKTFK